MQKTIVWLASPALVDYDGSTNLAQNSSSKRNRLLALIVRRWTAILCQICWQGLGHPTFVLGIGKDLITKLVLTCKNNMINAITLAYASRISWFFSGQSLALVEALQGPVFQFCNGQVFSSDEPLAMNGVFVTSERATHNSKSSRIRGIVTAPLHECIALLANFLFRGRDWRETGLLHLLRVEGPRCG